MRATLTLPVLALALVVAPPAAAAIDEDDQVAQSFDGTPIVYRMIYPDGASGAAPVPAVIVSPGYGGTRHDVDLRDPRVQQLLGAGYALLAYEARGFGQSGGEAQLASYDHEGRDISALIDRLASDPRIERQRPGDPRVGLVGGSYGGAITWVGAARDHRVEAAVVDSSWNDLVQTLLPDGVFKLTWSALLGAARELSGVGGGALPGGPAGAQTGGVDPRFRQAILGAAATGTFSEDSRAFLRSRGPWNVLDRVEAPTFILRATTDTVFPLSEAIANYEVLRARPGHPPLKMAWYCGGHGFCPDSAYPPDEGRILRWLDRYVKADASVDTGPPFEYRTQDAAWHGAARLPVPAAKTVSGTGSGVVSVNVEPTSGGGAESFCCPAVAHAARAGATTLKMAITAGPATVVGRPTVRLTETGVGSASDELRRAPLFFRLVDLATGEVLGNQVTPKVVAVDGREHRYEFPIEAVAYRLPQGHVLALEIVSSSVNFEPYRGAAVIDLKRIEAEIAVLPEGR